MISMVICDNLFKSNTRGFTWNFSAIEKSGCAAWFSWGKKVSSQETLRWKKCHRSQAPNGISRQAVTMSTSAGKNAAAALPEHNTAGSGSGDGSSVESLLSRTGSIRLKGVFDNVAANNNNTTAPKSVTTDNVHKIYHSGDLLSRTGSVRVTPGKKVDGNSHTMTPTTPVSMFSKTMGYNGALDDAIRSNGGKIKLHAASDASALPRTPGDAAHHKTPYVAFVKCHFFFFRCCFFHISPSFFHLILTICNRCWIHTFWWVERFYTAFSIFIFTVWCACDF